MAEEVWGQTGLLSKEQGARSKEDKIKRYMMLQMNKYPHLPYKDSILASKELTYVLHSFRY